MAKVNFTNLDKVFFREEGYTKGDIIEYYYAVSNIILPHLHNRPMVLNRHPNGIEGENFFQKQISITQIPSFVETCKVQHQKKVIDYLLVENLETLLYVANLGCIELNPFHSQKNSLLSPDYMVIDLDPENVPFELIIEVALSIHELLDAISAKNYCKTSGGRGLHIYVPLGAQYSFKESQDFAHIIGLIAESRYPRLVSLARSPKKRQQRIYVDYLRNSNHQTVASAYCIRPRTHAPVSTPLAWSEVKAGLNPIEFNIESVPKRVNKIGDIFKSVLGEGIDLNLSLLKLKNYLS